MWHAFSSWVGDLAHWASQWVVFSSFFALGATTAVRKEDSPGDEQKQDKFVSKLLVSIAIQVATGVISVSVGSYITLELISYRMHILEEQARTFDARQRALADRLTNAEKFNEAVRERHRLEELPPRLKAK